ncbi:MAG: hypothetical protein MPL62_08045 [Alphaproteobacteria bacterium]|nr:hypothetical protein [Alphaproteobacteria bacterium]
MLQGEDEAEGFAERGQGDAEGFHCAAAFSCSVRGHGGGQRRRRRRASATATVAASAAATVAPCRSQGIRVRRCIVP